jgi:maltose-binding protein MalE
MPNRRGTKIFATASEEIWTMCSSRASARYLKDRYGITVEIVPGSVASAYAKLMTSRSNPAFDVLITDDITLRSATKAGLIDEVSVADVPNMTQLYPNFMPLGGYGLPFFASVTALTYNKEHVAVAERSRQSRAQGSRRLGARTYLHVRLQNLKMVVDLPSTETKGLMIGAPLELTVDPKFVRFLP